MLSAKSNGRTIGVECFRSVYNKSQLNNLTSEGRFIRLTNAWSASRRMLSSKLNVSSQGPISLSSEKVYNEPLRCPTMDDLMEPYGPWKQAYDAENKRANFELFRGALALLISVTIFVNSGVIDGLYMPNLDNIMEETESFQVDKEEDLTLIKDP